MKKIKLDNIKLEKIFGGQKYMAIAGFDESKTAAVLKVLGFEIAFNPNSEAQISYILKNGPLNLKTYGKTDLNPHSVKIYTFEDIQKSCKLSI